MAFTLPFLSLLIILTQDDIEAYKIQNKFLNSEIYQLTKLWRNSSEQEKSLMVKVGLPTDNGCYSVPNASACAVEVEVGCG